VKFVLYFADGFGWHYFEETDFLAGSWTSAAPLQSILGYSSTIIPCLLTGRYPRDTGMFTEYYYSPRPRTRVETLLCAVGPVQTLADMVRLVLFRFARLRGMPEAHRLRISLRFAHLFDRHPIDYRKFPPIQMNVATIADLFADRGLRVEVRYLANGPSLPDELDLVRALAPDRDVFVYFDASIDTHGHHVGPATSDNQAQLDRVGAFLHGVWGVLGTEENERELLLFSDHGMSRVEHSFDVLDALRRFRLGKDYLVFLDSTMARFWFPTEEARNDVLTELANAPGRLLTAADREWAGIDFRDDRYGQEIIVAPEGTVFHPSYISPSFFRTGFPDKGMHGYWPTERSTYGVLAYRGSRLSSDRLATSVSAVDVFGTVEEILDGAPPDRT
jgi:type I phosphodiesterase/nucleotide pyrophosphatase